jgi:hypothetical protein
MCLFRQRDGRLIVKDFDVYLYPHRRDARRDIAAPMQASQMY